jgi:hypothetical protein
LGSSRQGFGNAGVYVLLLQDLVQSCARGGKRRVEDMCYERRRAEACVDESAHHALVNAGGREIQCVKEGGGAEGECERERALGVLLCHSLGH